jgi:cysteinyl-tRNA synthetase
MRIYNTLTRSKEEFVPLTPGEVRMYVCGMTVYDLCHIGHARMLLVFDVIQRYLRHRGYRVTFVRNFTDVDDKIIRRANQEGVEARVVSERNIDAFRVDMESIGVLPGDVEPKATEHIPQMLALIERLLAEGVAYVVDGDVYFDVRRFPPYGRLSGKNLDDLVAGARVEVDERKRDPRDFALWKSAKPGEPSWQSPWGAGRPGWHIECSAMSMQYLGESFDIHGGGEDLIFPHHECEIAQAEAVTHRPFARTWIHNGFVNLGAEKMSKSLGNTLTIRELLKRHRAVDLRLWLLGTHYRNPIEFGENRLGEAARGFDRLWDVVKAGRKYEASQALGDAQRPLPAQSEEYRDRFVAAMDDDFNTPQALGVLFEFGRSLNREAEQKVQDFARGARELWSLMETLGFAEPAPIHGLTPEISARITALIRARADARQQREWQRADEFRAELEKLDVVLKDTPAGTEWTWKGA